MRRMLFAAGLTAALATASVADARSACSDYAHHRKVTGTVVGALGGGLLGAAVAGHGDKGTGALLGAGLGAVAGNQVSRVHCRDRDYAYHRTRHTYAARRAPARATYPRYAVAGQSSCHYENRPYYGRDGRVVYAPMQVCQ